jgi:hypothetical protein
MAREEKNVLISIEQSLWEEEVTVVESVSCKKIISCL